jgi:hypothetical protein
VTPVTFVILSRDVKDEYAKTILIALSITAVCILLEVVQMRKRNVSLAKRDIVLCPAIVLQAGTAI